jgi:predicted Zn-dependent peptidase
VKNIENFITNSFTLPTSGKEQEYIVKEGVDYKENTVLFVNDKNAVQSQIYFYVNGEKYNPNMYADINAFNIYFGDGFSGLVLQEIREYRSLAYTAWGYYSIPYKKGIKSNLLGYVGCQTDKTDISLQVMDSLIFDMPKKPERTEMIKNKLSLKLQTSYPFFRDVPKEIAFYKRLGYTDDFRKKAETKYENLKFDDIYDFWKKNIYGKPKLITIYGNKKKLNIDNIKKYGKFIELKKKEIYKM